MPSATLVGAGLGLAAQLYCNALMKLPLMRSPWQHLIAMGAGAAFAAGVVQVEANAEKELAGGCASEVDACHFRVLPETQQRSGGAGTANSPRHYFACF